jgi:hypothetical protein
VPDLTAIPYHGQWHHPWEIRLGYYLKVIVPKAAIGVHARLDDTAASKPFLILVLQDE